MLLAALSLGASPRPSAAAIDWNAVALQQSQYPLPSPGPAAAATEPPADCVCCEITRTALQNYFEGQKPMGDLQMLNFDCEAELGKVLNFHSPTAAVRWGTLPSCKCARPAGRASLPAHLSPRLPLHLQVRLRDAAGGDAHRQLHDQPPRLLVPRLRPQPAAAAAAAAAPLLGVQGGGLGARGLGHVAHISLRTSPATGARAVLRGDDAAAAQVLLLVRADRRLAQRDEVRGPLPLGRRCTTGTRLGPGARSGPSPHTTPPHHPPPPSSGAWLPPAAFELLTEKYAPHLGQGAPHAHSHTSLTPLLLLCRYAPPECGADGEKAMVANKVRTRLGPGASSGRPTADPPHASRSSCSHQVLALVARKFPAMCKAVRENA